MKKIYLVTAGEYSDYSIYGVYSTKELAEEAAEQFNIRGGIETWDLDAIPDHPPGKVMWIVNMRKDGSLVAEGAYRNGVRIGEANRIEYAPRWEYDGRKKDYGRGVTAYVSFYMWAEDKEHAVKIANERRAQLIATNEWTEDYNKWYDAVFGIKGRI
jgi:hypothetical protein